MNFLGKSYISYPPTTWEIGDVLVLKEVGNPTSKTQSVLILEKFSKPLEGILNISSRANVFDVKNQKLKTLMFEKELMYPGWRAHYPCQSVKERDTWIYQPLFVIDRIQNGE